MEKLSLEQAVKFLENLSEVDGGCSVCFRTSWKAVYATFPSAANWLEAAEKAFPSGRYSNKDNLETIQETIQGKGS